jgi:hypothetical protein
VMGFRFLLLPKNEIEVSGTPPPARVGRKTTSKKKTEPSPTRVGRKQHRRKEEPLHQRGRAEKRHQRRKRTDDRNRSKRNPSTSEGGQKNEIKDEPHHQRGWAEEIEVSGTLHQRGWTEKRHQRRKRNPITNEDRKTKSKKRGAPPLARVGRTNDIKEKRSPFTSHEGAQQHDLRADFETQFFGRRTVVKQLHHARILPPHQVHIKCLDGKRRKPPQPVPQRACPPRPAAGRASYMHKSEQQMGAGVCARWVSGRVRRR